MTGETLIVGENNGINPRLYLCHSLNDMDKLNRAIITYDETLELVEEDAETKKNTIFSYEWSSGLS